MMCCSTRVVAQGGTQKLKTAQFSTKTPMRHDHQEKATLFVISKVSDIVES